MLYPIVKGLEQGKPGAGRTALCAIGTSVVFTVLDEYVFGLGSMPWKLDAALKMLAFALGGWFFLHSANRLPLRKAIICICGAGLLLIGGLSGVLLNGRVKYLSAVYGNIPVFYLSSISSVLGLCLLLMNLRSCTAAEYIGRRTLAVLVMHKFPILFFEWVCPGMKKWMASGLLPAELLAVALSIALCCLAEGIIMKLCPFMLGRFPRARRA